MFFFPPLDPAGAMPFGGVAIPVGAALVGGLQERPAAALGFGWPSNPKPGATVTGLETLAEVYAQYRERGGHRELEAWALANLGSIPVTELDRNSVHQWARKIYPKKTKAERLELLERPLAEILGLPPAEPRSPPWWAQRKAQKDAKDERARQQVMELIRPSHIVDNSEINRGRDWSRVEYYGHLHGDPSGGWASVHTPGPPPDPPDELADPGGRPRQYSSNAERQRAYRERKKEADK